MIAPSSAPVASEPALTARAAAKPGVERGERDQAHQEDQRRQQDVRRERVVVGEDAERAVAPGTSLEPVDGERQAERAVRVGAEARARGERGQVDAVLDGERRLFDERGRGASDRRARRRRRAPTWTSQPTSPIAVQMTSTAASGRSVASAVARLAPGREA